MPLVFSIFGQVVGTLLQFLLKLVSQDRRSLVLERRGKVVALAKEMREAGLSPAKLKALEKQLTDEN